MDFKELKVLLKNNHIRIKDVAFYMGVSEPTLKTRFENNEQYQQLVLKEFERLCETNGDREAQIKKTADEIQETMLKNGLTLTQVTKKVKELKPDMWIDLSSVRKVLTGETSYGEVFNAVCDAIYGEKKKSNVLVSGILSVPSKQNTEIEQKPISKTAKTVKAVKPIISPAKTIVRTENEVRLHIEDLRNAMYRKSINLGSLIREVRRRYPDISVEKTFVQKIFTGETISGELFDAVNEVVFGDTYKIADRLTYKTSASENELEEQKEAEAKYRKSKARYYQSYLTDTLKELIEEFFNGKTLAELSAFDFCGSLASYLVEKGVTVSVTALKEEENN